MIPKLVLKAKRPRHRNPEPPVPGPGHKRVPKQRPFYHHPLVPDYSRHLFLLLKGNSRQFSGLFFLISTTLAKKSHHPEDTCHHIEGPAGTAPPPPPHPKKKETGTLWECTFFYLFKDISKTLSQRSRILYKQNHESCTKCSIQVRQHKAAIRCMSCPRFQNTWANLIGILETTIGILYLYP